MPPPGGRSRRMADVMVRGETIRLDDFDKVVVKFRRTVKVVKGGKRFGIGALVVIGDRRGRVAWGYGKANEVPFAVDKAVRDAAKRLIVVPVTGVLVSRHRGLKQLLLSTGIETKR